MHTKPSAVPWGNFNDSVTFAAAQTFQAASHIFEENNALHKFCIFFFDGCQSGYITLCMLVIL